MGSVLIDNLSLRNIMESISSTPGNVFTESMQNYLYASVLWDKVCTLGANRYSGSRLRVQGIYDDYLKVSVIENDYWGMECVSEQLAKEFWNSEKETVEAACVKKDAIFYLLAGYNLGRNVLLSGERARFVERAGINEKLYTRLDIINRLDREVRKFYHEINEELGKEMVKVQSPLLLDYIAKNAGSFDEAKRLAFDIKKEKHLKEFRETMDRLEALLNEGNLVRFHEYISVIPDIVNEIKCSGIKTQTVDIGISASPSITFSVKRKIFRERKKMLHINFLTDLAKYGMYERFGS